MTEPTTTDSIIDLDQWLLESMEDANFISGYSTLTLKWRDRIELLIKRLRTAEGERDEYDGALTELAVKVGIDYKQSPVMVSAMLMNEFRQLREQVERLRTAERGGER